MNGREREEKNAKLEVEEEVEVGEGNCGKQLDDIMP
jgi:hypothetical protein